VNIIRHTQAALVAALLAAGSLTPLAPAHAAVAIQFDSGNVAFGYSDGYWDRAHHWHRWPNTAARNDWHAHNHAHYYTHNHTHDRGAGWRSDHWWDHH
jgi:hypothetical protein